MSLRSITVHLDERWYDALARQAKKENETVEEKLDGYLDAMINQLPKRVFEKVSREIWEEQRREAEASRRISVLRVTQGGRTDHLLMESTAPVDTLSVATALRSYLLAKAGDPSLRFTERLRGAADIAPEVFQDYAEELRQGGGRTDTALDIDLDRSEFSMLDRESGHWLKYVVRDVILAAWRSQRDPDLTRDQQRMVFDSHLEGRDISVPEGPAAREAPGMEDEASPTMGLSL